MSSRKLNDNLSLYFQAVYALQLAAVVGMFAGMFLIWWEGLDRLTALDLLGQTTGTIAQRSPQILGQPLLVLWLVWPSIVVSGLRSFTGLLVAPVSFRWLAVAAWVAALGAIVHFYISFGGDAGASPLHEGEIRPGFWLTALATIALGGLLAVESRLKPRAAIPGVDDRRQPVTDAESLWRGDYLPCPYCGTLNRRRAKTCCGCGILLFDFEDGDRQRKP